MKSIDQYWYSKNPVSLILLPLSWLFITLAVVRRTCFQLGIFRQYQLPVPVIIVGNISAGGTGKTPLTESLVRCLKQHGYNPGIVSRGYGGKAQNWPQQVRADSDPVMVGDEPVLLAQRCQCPVAVDPKRVRAANALHTYHHCDVIIADDGLQHYQLGRDLEIVVIDGQRRFGNGRCIPAGPLRETTRRLISVDFIVVNNGFTLEREYSMKIRPGELYRVNNPAMIIDKDSKASVKIVHAVAGIGNPPQFFALLRTMGLNVIEHSFADHYEFRPADIVFNDEFPVIMTEKDAVKCRRFASDNTWYLEIESSIDNNFNDKLLARLKTIQSQKKSPQEKDSK